MCKHVCSNKIVYFTISALAVVSVTDNISMALILNRLLWAPSFSLSQAKDWLCSVWLPSSVLIEQVRKALNRFYRLLSPRISSTLAQAWSLPWLFVREVMFVLEICCGLLLTRKLYFPFFLSSILCPCHWWLSVRSKGKDFSACVLNYSDLFSALLELEACVLSKTMTTEVSGQFFLSEHTGTCFLVCLWSYNFL